MLDVQKGPVKLAADRAERACRMSAQRLTLRLVFLRIIGVLALSFLSASAEGCQQFAAPLPPNAQQHATQSPRFAPRQRESSSSNPVEAARFSLQTEAQAMISQRRKNQSSTSPSKKQIFDSLQTNGQNPVQPAAAQFPDQSGTAESSPPPPVFRSEFMSEHNPDRIPGSQSSFTSQDEAEIYEMNRVRPKIASERVVDLTDENFYLRELLKKRDAENHSLQDELARARATIIAANRAVNNSVRQIDELQQSLSARDEQLQQMHLLIKEHERSTADRLKRLTNTIRQSIEQEMKSRDQPNFQTPDLIPGDSGTKLPGTAAPELLPPLGNSAKTESRVPKGTR